MWTTSALRKADLNPNDWDGRALLCLVPFWLLKEQEAGRGGQATQPPGGAQGSQKVSPPPRCAGREPGPCTLSPAEPAAWLRQHSHAWEVTSAAPEAMATCRKQAAGRAGLGNLKQH